MANPATPEDIVNRWRPLSEQETVNAQTFLDDAYRMLKRRVATIDVQMDEDPDLLAEVVRIMATAVMRVMKNPDGKRQESIDDYSWTRDQAISAGLLYFTEDELSVVLPTAGRRAFSITTATPAVTYGDGLDDRPDLWLQFR